MAVGFMASGLMMARVFCNGPELEFSSASILGAVRPLDDVGWRPDPTLICSGTRSSKKALEKIKEDIRRHEAAHLSPIESAP